MRKSSGLLIPFAFIVLIVFNYSPVQAIPLFDYDARDFGARGDGITLDTKALQAAIDSCSHAGGGTVILAGGTFLSGTIYLQNYVTLQIENGATLLASTNLADYPLNVPERRSYTDNYTDKSLIYAEKVNHIALQGLGVIDGQGGSFELKRPAAEHYRERPYLIRMIDCDHIHVRDVTLRNSAMWVQHYLNCEDLLIDGITVQSRVNANNDGIDIDGCRRVRIANCNVSSGDDALVFKSTFESPCENVVVTNCILSSDCNAIKMGTESNGGFRNITISNCVVYDTRLCGIALEVVDGGEMDQIIMTDVIVKDTQGAIFLRLGDRARPFREGISKPAVGRMRNILLQNIRASGADSIGCSITGLAGHEIENVTLSNVAIHFKGGGTLANIEREIPDLPANYPEYKMFGPLPAFGFFCRHVKNLNMKDTELTYFRDDLRPAIFCQDVDELILSDIKAQALVQSPAQLYFRRVKNARITDCQPKAPLKVFLRAEDVQDIILQQNDFTNIQTIVESDKQSRGIKYKMFNLSPK